jgi:hypothetical protein
MKVTITTRIASRTMNWNKIWLANWEKKGQPRLREDGTPCQPGEPTGTSYQELKCVATGADGGTLRMSSPVHLRQQTLAEIERRAIAAWPNCEIEIKEVA